MMILYDGHNFEDVDEPETIYSFDIETTSLFENPDTGEWEVFDYAKPPKYYEGCQKAGVPYIWMFGVNDKVYYGTDFSDVERILLTISGKCKKIVWVHNLGYEFQFMRDFLNKYTIESMIARSTRKPIAFYIEEMNIQFRCSYMLTNLSLEKAAERYTSVKKLVGGLDYNKARNPRTVAHMSQTELKYCEMDIVTLYNIICAFKKEYKRLSWIPYTQTGEIRKAFRKLVPFSYVLSIARRTPTDLIYLALQKAFQGGMTHGNCVYLGEIMENIASKDISSSYPRCFFFKMPMGKFREIIPESADDLNREKFAVLYHVEFRNIESKYLNKYILCSKIISGEGIKQDNGRLVKADRIEMYLTEVDYDIITKRAYSIESKKILHAWSALKAYLPVELIKFMLELYANKTTLKGVIGREDFYMKSKQMLNGL